MSKKKGAASSRNGRDSNAQRLGVTPIVALFVIGLLLLPWIKSREYKLAEA